MELELIGKSEVEKRAASIKELAWSIAQASNTLSGYYTAPECLQYMDYLSCTHLKEGEKCILIDGISAKQITKIQGSQKHGKVLA